MATASRRVIVIGAGLSGLVCAHRLKQLGLDVLVLERSEIPGGVIRTDRVDGYLIERGPNSSQGTEDLLNLIDELGENDSVVEGDPKAPAYVYFGGRLHAVPSGPGAFLRSKLLSARGKLRILGELFVSPSAGDGEESLASFARRRIGSEAAERLVAPFVSGIFAGDANQLSAQAAFPRLANLEKKYGGLIKGSIAKAREARKAKKGAAQVLEKAAPARRHLVSFVDGMAHLPRILARSLGEDFVTGISDCNIHTIDATDSSQSPGRPRFSVEFIRDGRKESVGAEQLVVATPSQAAAELLRTVSSDLSDSLGEILYPPLAIVYLAYSKSAVSNPLQGFGFLVAPSEPLRILGCVWSSSLFQGRAPEGMALLTVFVGGARHPELALLPDDELVSTVHADLRRVLQISGDPRVISITHYQRSIPQYNLGHADRVKKIEQLLNEIPGLFLVGNYLHGVSTGDCVSQGELTARRVVGPSDG